MKQSHITFRDYRVLYDGQKDGYDACAASLAWVEDELWCECKPAFEDDEAGHQPFLVRTKDLGRTWTAPAPFGPPVIREASRESVFLMLNGPFKSGTLFANGFHLKLGVENKSRIFENQAFRDYPVFVGRKEQGRAEFDWTWYESGTFLGEQFIERGLQLPSGRLVFQIWGVKQPGENWRCGVLLSDDDGKTWRYREVGYESDLGIRDNPAIPAGFNEQTLFRTRDGKLVSIIRAREKLGRLAESPDDTWFYRSMSSDDGETWSQPQPTNLPGTGATGLGLTLPDGSLLQACRIPYSRAIYPLPEKDLYGLHIARSFDEGATWQTAGVWQRDPDGNVFDNYYNTMNGQFVELGEDSCLYTFGQFDLKAKRHRILAVGVRYDG